MDCSEFRDTYSDFADGLLDELGEISAHRHLSECAACRRFHESLQWGVNELRRQPRVVPSNDFALRLERRLRAEESALAIGMRRWSGATAMLLSLTLAASATVVLMLDHQRREALHQAEAPGPVPLLDEGARTKRMSRLAPLMAANEAGAQNPLKSVTTRLESFGAHRTSFTGQLTASWTGR